MYQLFKALSTKDIVFTQFPVFALSLGIAELFYKFHSFVLESLAFLATWFVLDMIVSLSVKFTRTDKRLLPQLRSAAYGRKRRTAGR